MTAGGGRRLTGQCLCGAIAYEVDDDFAYAMNCHCIDCRRATGAACKPLAGIARNRLHIVRGAEAVIRHGGPVNHDILCGTCGSLLYSIVREGAYAHVAMGTLTDSPSIAPQMHIFVASKAPWHRITDDLPQYAGLPED
ncbi:GFA family protein [Sphingobium sp. H39-3-25]|uniref:GFA family protein n=1 Tax=Sphingobium arseniciresistens TaxID=3030834 RepID=UPI0023B99405|nr:GFA family protein [Sphingobium arseniciresistens]